MIHLTLAIVLAAGLPGFDEFQRADRERRESGKWETAESAALTTVDAGKILAVAAKQPADAFLQWGAAELLSDWTNRQVRFDAALAGSGSNAVIALRYGCAAAEAGQRELAVGLLRLSRQADPSNAVPWLAEAWLTRQPTQPRAGAFVFADGSALAARARIRALERVGYSAYAARRIGYAAAMPALTMLRDLSRRNDLPAEWLRQVALTMQQSPTLLVTELVGQSVENSLGATADRVADLKDRREDITARTREVGEHIVPLATEAELVQYYDDMLTLGEETALKRLKAAVEAGRRRR
jgi:hypothetical protein